jgi:signal transduction histidine kinase
LVTAVNPAALALMGITDASGVIGFPVRSLASGPRLGQPETDGIDEWAVVRALLEDRIVETALVYGVEPNGVRTPVSSIALSLRDDDGEVIGAVTVFRDISDQVRMDRAKSEFLAMTGHELRTPLTAIHAALTLVVSGALGKLPEELRPSLTVAASNSTRLVKLVNDILTLQQMTLDKVELNVSSVQSMDLLANVVGLNTSAARQAEVEIRLHGAGFVADLDEERMGQALSNLVQNAVKFSPKGSAIDVSAYEADGHGVFEITDEGDGIPVDRLNDIFGRFEQVDSSDTRLFGGVGLGLAIVDRHGGEVWVDRTGTTGTVFKLSVPLPA